MSDVLIDWCRKAFEAWLQDNSTYKDGENDCWEMWQEAWKSAESLYLNSTQAYQEVITSHSKKPTAIIAEKLVSDIVASQLLEIKLSLSVILGLQVLDIVMERIKQAIIKNEGVYSCVIMQKIDESARGANNE